ncbi:MAG TPA: glycosyltransferase [Pyrinomonadaceae bacterium]|nr:glycosyltransferase [Pyrinomonadaceae bacterium]
MQEQFDVSVVLGTYNRGQRLRGAIESLIAQEAEGVRFEIIIVDNNSTDDTNEIVTSFQDSDPRVRYVFEPHQGISHARNAGILHSHSPIVAFTDDDVRVAPNWIATIKKTFDAHPEIGFIGGKVLPIWTVPPPAWLTRNHWSPLGVQDHGDVEFYLEPSRVTGVIGANLVVRREAFERVGTFSPKVQLVKGSIGTMEDHEYVDRMWRAGIIGLYVPQLIVEAPVESDRVKKKYHRRWHRGHGRSYAIMKEERMEKASWYLFGVPAHLYRQALIDAIGLVTHWLRRQEEHAFLCEVHLRFFFAFWLRRVQDIRFKTTGANT